jgi:hypothetical protein
MPCIQCKKPGVIDQCADGIDEPGYRHISLRRPHESDASVRDVLAHDLTIMKEDVRQCRACHRAMVTTSSHVMEDEKGAMTITRWRCRPCHETAEEIWLSTGYSGPDPLRIRYEVAPPRRRCRIAPPARAAARRGSHVYAGTI